MLKRPDGTNKILIEINIEMNIFLVFHHSTYIKHNLYVRKNQFRAKSQRSFFFQLSEKRLFLDFTFRCPLVPFPGSFPKKVRCITRTHPIWGRWDSCLFMIATTKRNVQIKQRFDPASSFWCAVTTLPSIATLDPQQSRYIYVSSNNNRKKAGTQY